MNIRFFSNQCRYVDSIDFRNRWNPCSVYAANWVSHSTNQSQRSSFTNSYIMEQCEWRIDNFFSPALNIFCVNAPRYHLIGLMICIWKMQKAISHCLWFFAKFRHSWPFCRLEIEINNLKQLWWIFNWRATVNTIAADERSFFLLHIVRLMRAIFQRRFVSIFIVCWNFSVDIDDRFSFFLRFVRESVQMTRPDLVREVDDNVRKNFFSPEDRNRANIRRAVEIASKIILDVITFVETFFYYIFQVVWMKWYPFIESVEYLDILWVHGNQRTLVFAHCTVSITADFARMNNKCVEISIVFITLKYSSTAFAKAKSLVQFIKWRANALSSVFRPLTTQRWCRDFIEP